MKFDLSTYLVHCRRWMSLGFDTATHHFRCLENMPRGTIGFSLSAALGNLYLNFANAGIPSDG